MTTLLSDLRSGELGMSWQFPETLQAVRDEELQAEFVDPNRPTRFWVLFFIGLHLDLSARHEATLRRDVENHCRFLFEHAFKTLDRPAEGAPAQPRTSDPGWSPVVDCDLLEVGGARALRVVHRMHYEPGLESILGHLLVPLRRGLLEVRCAASSQFTGLRESALTLEAIDTVNDLDADDAFLRNLTPTFDAPSNDDRFPDHPLSVVRAALRWCESLHPRISTPPLDPPDEVTIAPLRCAFVPPPRFLVVDGSQWHELARVSIAGTDGIDRLVVTKWGRRGKHADSASLARQAMETSRDLFVAAGVQGVVCTAIDVPGVDERRYAFVIVEGQGHIGSLRSAMCFFPRADNRIWSISITTTIAQPRELLVDELRHVVGTWRETGSVSRPWWKLWS